MKLQFVFPFFLRIVFKTTAYSISIGDSSRSVSIYLIDIAKEYLDEKGDVEHAELIFTAFKYRKYKHIGNK